METLDEFEAERFRVSGGTLWIDGGNMFGVVPRVLWQRKCPPDEQNRILLETNCLLVRTAGHRILIDSGYGSKLDDKSRANCGAQEGDPLLRSLAAQGIVPDDIDIVILTHLHFDHAGGCTLLNGESGLRPTFPRARHFVQRCEWDDATANLPELAGSYFPRDFVPLEEAGLVEFVDDEAEILPGLRVLRTGGHTRGHQIIYIGRPGQRAVYLADMCPYAAHMRTFWSMAYDQFPLDQRRVKPKVLGEAADSGDIVLFDHDPQIKAARIARDAKQEFTVRELIPL
jgi:glyoxylase-like metal-dependent hydrolase (beta-lactamase superfamily II)